MKPARTLSQGSAEQSVLYHLILTPSLITEFCGQVNLDALTTPTRAAVNLIAEFPSLCADVGVLAVADYVRVDQDLFDLIIGLAYLPEWAAVTLPAWSVALNYLAASWKLVRLGALEQWRSEVSRGINGQRLDSPATWHFDTLWKAACFEAAALESWRMGLHATAVEQMQKAIGELARNSAAPELAA